MLTKKDFPILEFDPTKRAKINPDICTQKLPSDKLVITFFKEVIDDLLSENKITPVATINGENPFDVYSFTDSPDVHIILGQIGCPACAGNLDILTGMGISKVMFCGGGGVLRKDIQVGKLLLVEGAIRDEGFSYHYIEPSRIIYSDKAVTEKLKEFLDQKKVPYISGLVWTTDAMFRETEDRIQARKEEGALIVEMEQAGCIAVSQFRGIEYGAIIYGGDDVSQMDWDHRSWQSRKSTRYNLIQLCKELVKEF